MFVFLARELTPSRLVGDETHAITEFRIELGSLKHLCRTGELQDACAIAALYLTLDYLACPTFQTLSDWKPRRQSGRSHRP